MALLDIPVEVSPKNNPIHPWKSTIKDEFSQRIKRAHNSIGNVLYPKPKVMPRSANRIKFEVHGNRVTKEFIYCVHMVQTMYKYRWKLFDPPTIKAYTGVEWVQKYKELRDTYDSLSYQTNSQVIVICNDKFLGDDQELKKMIEINYVYHILLNYHKESIKNFAQFLKDSGRPCAYMHISINGKEVGSLIFMLYSNICPVTCENFLRLCRSKRGGYSGTPVHRIVKDGWIQCGGFGLKNVKMGCENYIVEHDRRGVLGMANAGRNVDCSTQFFVLLQPCNWMKNKFVAFGQLIDGEETLRKIEQVETYYEAPKAEIIIYAAGVVNLECQDIMVNKNAREHINLHIEDLVTIGQLFTEMLIERLYLELEFRHIQTLEPSAGEEMITNEEIHEGFDEEGNATKEIVTTHRYIKKKYPKQEAINENDEKPDEDNYDYDVEDYEPEEYKYPQTRVHTPPPYEGEPRIPYYLALTDVPCSGDEDSNYDLKRFLQGDYCLPLDIEPGMDVRMANPKQKDLKIADIILPDDDLFAAMRGCSYTDDEETAWPDPENVSFPGIKIQSVVKRNRKPIAEKQKATNEIFTDEDLRQLRLGSTGHKELQSDMEEEVEHLKSAFRASTDVSSEKGPRVRIVSDNPLRASSTAILRNYSEARSSARQSVLVRLFDEVGLDETTRLKDYIPQAELKLRKMKDSMSDSDIFLLMRDNTKQLLKQSMTEDDELSLRERGKQSRLIKPGIRFGVGEITPGLASTQCKNRPSMTVEQYREMNRKKELKMKSTPKSSGLKK